MSKLLIFMVSFCLGIITGILSIDTGRLPDEAFWLAEKSYRLGCDLEGGQDCSGKALAHRRILEEMMRAYR